MADDGIKSALGFFTSAFNSYSGCRQYRENIEHARAHLGAAAPTVHKLRACYNHPGFIEAMRDRVHDSLEKMRSDRHSKTKIVFTAHSIPLSMASGSEYASQLAEACQLVAEAYPGLSWELVYQSRSGPPTQPWLEPDVCDYLKQLHHDREYTDIVLVPIGFVSDHMEVLFDLDTEAQQLCSQLELNMVRAKTVGTHPKFVGAIRELILERTAGAERKSLGTLGPSHDVCPEDCCPAGRPARNAQ